MCDKTLSGAERYNHMQMPDALSQMAADIRTDGVNCKSDICSNTNALKRVATKCTIFRNVSIQSSTEMENLNESARLLVDDLNEKRPIRYRYRYRRKLSVVCPTNIYLHQKQYSDVNRIIM